jgi:hypothetical protein
MTLPDPTHWVTVQCPKTHAIRCYQAFDLGHAESILRAYRELGWCGVIEERKS